MLSCIFCIIPLMVSGIYCIILLFVSCIYCIIYSLAKLLISFSYCRDLLQYTFQGKWIITLYCNITASCVFQYSTKKYQRSVKLIVFIVNGKFQNWLKYGIFHPAKGGKLKRNENSFQEYYFIFISDQNLSITFNLLLFILI